MLKDVDGYREWRAPVISSKPALEAALHPHRRRILTLIGVAAGAGGGLTAVLLWAPPALRGWLSGVLAAVISGIGVNLVLPLVQKVRLPGGPPDPDPVAVSVAVKHAHFFHLLDETGMPIQVPCSGYTLQVAVEALDDRAVILSSMRPAVLSRRPPSGILSPHAGILKPRPFAVLLDDDPPRLVPRGSGKAGFPFTVQKQDPELFELTVETKQWDVTWLLELDWICAGRAGTKRIDLAGSPFRTIARPPGHALEWRAAHA